MGRVTPGTRLLRQSIRCVRLQLRLSNIIQRIILSDILCIIYHLIHLYASIVTIWYLPSYMLLTNPLSISFLYFPFVLNSDHPKRRLALSSFRTGMVSKVTEIVVVGYTKMIFLFLYSLITLGTYSSVRQYLRAFTNINLQHLFTIVSS